VSTRPTHTRMRGRLYDAPAAEQACQAGHLAARAGRPPRLLTHSRSRVTLALPRAAGFFAKDMAAFQAAAGVLLDARSRRPTTFRRLLLARDAFAVADAPASAALMQACGARFQSGADARTEPRCWGR